MKKIIGGTKDENGIFTKDVPPISLSKTEQPTDVHIDALLEECLRVLKKAVQDIKVEVGLGSPSREVIMNLKDVTTMLWDFKKKEQEFLDNASDEQLEKMLK